MLEERPFDRRSRDVEPAPGGSSRVRRKPPSPGYRVSAVPKSYGDHVQLGAVLRPVYGRLRTDADIATATAWTRHYWRRRAQQLLRPGIRRSIAKARPRRPGCPMP